MTDAEIEQVFEELQHNQTDLSSIVSMNPVAESKNPLRELINFSKTYDKDKVQRKELCSHHNLRKTLLCLTCKTFICDKCLITKGENSHFGHKTSQLSTLAYDV